MHVDNCNCFAVRSAARHVSQFYDQYMAPLGLSTNQFTILAVLQRRGPLTINALAADLVMDRTTLGRNVLPLEREGLITIKSSGSDGRAKELQLTKVGERRFQAASKRWSAAQKRFDAVVGSKRAADLRELLRTVVGSQLAG